MTLPPTQVAPFPLKRFMAFLAMLKIQTKDFGLINFKMLGTQTYVLDEMCRALDQGVTTFYILKARQLGMSTFFIALDLFWAMEYSGLLGSVITHTDQAKALFRNYVKVFFANLPKTHKIKWDQENREMIVLRNSSILQYLVAGTKEKAKGALGRSAANNFLHCTEVAFWGSPDDLNEISATMSSHYPHRLKIEETTANGFNFWEERWRNGKDDPTVCCIFVGWWRHDHYQFPDEHPWFRIFMPKGHESPLTMLERKRVNEVRRRYGVEITKNQIAWYRHHLDTEVGGDQIKMDEQFPWIEEDAFVATGSQFFIAQHLTDGLKRARTVPFMPFKYQLGEHWADTMVNATRDQNNAELRVWEEAKADGHYSIGCDPAYGSSESADRAVIHVARCFSDRIVQVAEFVSPTVSTYQCAWVLAHLAGYFRNCTVIIEINGPGEAVFSELSLLKRETARMVASTESDKHDLRNVLRMMRHYLYARPDSVTQTLAMQWRSSGVNKPPMLSAFKDAFELKRFVLNSMPLLEEMKTIIIDGGAIEAETGKKDDRVIAAGLAYEAYRRRIRSRLQAINLTYAEAYKEPRHDVTEVAEKIAINYLRSAGLYSEKLTNG